MGFRVLSYVILAGFLIGAFPSVSTAQDESTAPTYQSASDIPMELFAQLPKIEQAKISPDGNNLAIIYPVDGEAKFVIFDVRREPQNPPLIIDTGNGILDWFVWANNDRLLFSLAEISFTYSRNTIWIGYKYNLRAIDKDGKDQRKLFINQKTLNLLHLLPNDNDNVLIQTDFDEPDGIGVYKENIYKKDHEAVVLPKKGVTSWSADYSGNVRFGWGELNKKQLLMARTSLEEEWVELQTNNIFESQEFTPIAFGFDKETIFVKSSLNTGRDIIYKFNLKHGMLEEKVFDHPIYDVDDVIVSEVKQKILAGVYTADFPELEYMDDDFKATHDRISKALGGMRFGYLHTTPDNKFSILRSYSSSDPGTLYIYDDEAKELSPIWDVMPDLPTDLLSPVKKITYFARDGLELTAYLTIPKDTDGTNLKTIILPHGGPFLRDDMTFNPEVQFLVSRGYAVFQPNYRGSTGYGERFEAMGYGEWGGKMQEDITDGVRWLIREGISDPDKICIVGGSYGGYAALMGLVQTPDLYQCGVAMAPVTDLGLLLSDSNSKYEKEFFKLTATGGKKKSKYKKVSPRYLGKGFKDPVLLIHGDKDDNVPIEHSKRMVKALKRAKKDYEYIILEGAGHTLIKEKHRLIYFEALEKFLAEHLGD